MAEWSTPVFDRTQGDVDYAKAQLSAGVNNVEFKGCLNQSDINRIEKNSKYLSDSLKELYYFNEIVYNLWNDTSIPSKSHISRIINNVSILWGKYYKPPDAVDLPTTMLTYEQVNAIEKNLYLIKEMIENMIISFRECGTFNCGEE